MATLSEPARTLLLGAGAPARMARDLRYRLPLRSRCLDHPALRNLHSIRCLYRARPDRDDPAVQWDADLVVDGLRPRDGEHANINGQPVAALVSVDREATCRGRPFRDPGICLSGDRVALGYHSAMVRLHHRAASPRPIRADDGSARIAAFLGNPVARKLCERNELRDFSDVLCILGTLSVVARQGGEPSALLCLSGQSLHPCGRVDPFWPLRSGRAGFGGRSRRGDGDLSDACGVWIRSGKGADAATRRRVGCEFALPRHAWGAGDCAIRGGCAALGGSGLALPATARPTSNAGSVLERTNG